MIAILVVLYIHFVSVGNIFPAKNFAQITIGAKTGLSLPGDDFAKSYSKVSDSVGNSQDLPTTVSNLGASGFHLIGSVYIDLGDNLKFENIINDSKLIKEASKSDICFKFKTNNQFFKTPSL